MSSATAVTASDACFCKDASPVKERQYSEANVDQLITDVFRALSASPDTPLHPDLVKICQDLGVFDGYIVTENYFRACLLSNDGDVKAAEGHVHAIRKGFVDAGWEVSDMVARKHEKALRSDFVHLFPSKDENGGAIVGMNWGKYDTDLCSGEEFLQACVFAMCKIVIENLKEIENGITVIWNFDGCSIGLLRKITRADLSRFLAINGIAPLIISKIYIVNAPTVFRWTLKVVIPTRLKSCIKVVSKRKFLAAVGPEKVLFQYGGDLNYDWQAFVTQLIGSPVMPRLS